MSVGLAVVGVVAVVGLLAARLLVFVPEQTVCDHKRAVFGGKR